MNMTSSIPSTENSFDDKGNHKVNVYPIDPAWGLSFATDLTYVWLPK